jgi:hypothetical protein
MTVIPEMNSDNENIKYRRKFFLFFILAFIAFFGYGTAFFISVLNATDLLSKLSTGMQESDIEERLNRDKEVYYSQNYQKALQSVSNPYQKKGDLMLPIEHKVSVYHINNLFIGSRLYIFYNNKNIVTCIFVEDFHHRPFWYRIVKQQKF